jgi:hypothetical protein
MPQPDRPPVLDQQPERGDVRHVGVDGVPHRPLKRTATNPSMAALKAPPIISAPDTPLPVPPLLPTEHAKTQRAPSTTATTVRATPASGQEAVRIVEPATSPPSGTLPPASQDPRDGRLAALERENERLRALQSLPPDRGAWAKLGYRLAAAAVGAAILVIAALGARMADKVGKVEDKNAGLVKAQKKSKEQVVTREKLWNDWGDRLVEVIECRHRKQVELNQRQFPEVQRAEPGPWPVFKNACGELPERPRELPAPPADVTEPP